MDVELARQRLVAHDSVVPSSAPSVAQCTRSFLSLQGESGVGAEAARNAFVRELGRLELDYAKLELAVARCEEEVRQYGQTGEEIDQQIATAQSDIEGLQQELAAAQLARQRKEELEALAERVNEELPRSTLENEIAQVMEELQEMEAKRSSVLNQVDLRKRQFQLMMHSMAELTKTI